MVVWNCALTEVSGAVSHSDGWSVLDEKRKPRILRCIPAGLWCMCVEYFRLNRNTSITHSAGDVFEDAQTIWCQNCFERCCSTVYFRNFSNYNRTYIDKKTRRHLCTLHLPNVPTPSFTHVFLSDEPATKICHLWHLASDLCLYILLSRTINVPSPLLIKNNRRVGVNSPILLNNYRPSKTNCF